MYVLRLPIDADTSAFREAAKRALSNDLKPADITFVSHDSGIFFEERRRGPSISPCPARLRS